jgi:hypothetical protein
MRSIKILRAALLFAAIDRYGELIRKGNITAQ